MAQSRFEKFQKYRDQIQNQEELTKVFATENDAVTKYRNEINALSPNILLDSQPIHFDFLTFTSIDKSKRKEISEIKKFIDSFDFVLLNKIRDTANHIICESSNNLYEEFDKNWITNDRGWIILKENDAYSRTCAEKYVEFKEKIPVSINKLKAIVDQATDVTKQSKFTSMKVDFSHMNIRLKQRKWYLSAMIGMITFVSLSVVVLIVSLVLTFR